MHRFKAGWIQDLLQNDLKAGFVCNFMASLCEYQLYTLITVECISHNSSSHIQIWWSRKRCRRSTIFLLLLSTFLNFVPPESRFCSENARSCKNHSLWPIPMNPIAKCNKANTEIVVCVWHSKSSLETTNRCSDRYHIYQYFCGTLV